MNKILALLTLLYSGIIFSQTSIDENITIKFPSKPKTLENVVKTDTLNQSIKTILKTYYLNSKEESYVTMRLKILTNEDTEPNLPKSQIELIKNYKQFIAGQLKGFSQKGMNIKDSTQITFNNYLAYKLTFKEVNSEEENGQSLILYLDGIYYEFIYSKVASYNQKNKEIFFKSIKINDSENLKQFTEPYNYWNALFKILLGIIFIYLIRKYRKMEKKRNLIK
ncbi:hypothetical protein [Flavobacterium ardleyense]|uniref:hypothetical protein n=1 Tax=Flavobacterium ardleyense TaxID=2038737 RepID=UPI00298C7894|nr:hypothetical protein [Flavobacterium ardleyense]